MIEQVGEQPSGAENASSVQIRTDYKDIGPLFRVKVSLG